MANIFPRDLYPNYWARSEKTIDVLSHGPANYHTLYKWPPHLIIESFSFCVLSQSNIKPGSLPAFLLNEWNYCRYWKCFFIGSSHIKAQHKIPNEISITQTTARCFARLPSTKALKVPRIIGLVQVSLGLLGLIRNWPNALGGGTIANTIVLSVQILDDALL